MIHSISEKVCSGCAAKLTSCDAFWQNWFKEVKEKWPDAHIAWGFRGEADQNADFQSGRSLLQWPNSKHNFILNGLPNSLALDLFQISQMAKAIFDPKWCASVFNWSLSQGYWVQWGGNFQHLKDMDHFEIAVATLNVSGPESSEGQGRH